jgi:uncharacterized protein
MRKLNYKSSRRALLVGIMALGLGLGFHNIALAKASSEPSPKLWVLKDADSTVYVFGSIHLLKADTKWRTQSLDEAFSKADTLYLEVPNADDQAAAQAAMMKYGIDPEGGLLKGYSPKEVDLIRATFAKHGLNIDQLATLKPSIASLILAITVMKKAGFDPSLGVDKYFENAAKTRQLPINGFETIDEQIQALADGDIATQKAELLMAVKDDNRNQDLLERLLTAWRKGDLKALDKLMIREMRERTPESYQRLMVKRNANWIPQIKRILAGSGTQMIVVGAGHLVGEESVFTMLKKEGIEAHEVKP